MDTRLLEKLRDPDTGEPLALEGQTLVNPATGRRFTSQNAIPNLLPARPLAQKNQSFQKFYDWIAVGYDFAEQRVGRWLYGGQVVEARRAVVSRLELSRARSLLVVSVGTGRDLEILELLKPQTAMPLAEMLVVGVDLSRGMLARCQAKSRRGRFSFPLELLQADAEALPFADGAFDAVLHVGGINFFAHPDQGLAQMARVARPGSRVVVADETEMVLKKSHPITPAGKRMLSHPAINRKTVTGWLPSGAREVGFDDSLWGGRFYRLDFRLG